jgi:hypothetical protein
VAAVRPPRATTLLALALAIGPWLAPHARADESVKPLSGEPTKPRNAADLINWAFAHRLGSGIYATSSGESVQIYRIPLSARLRRADEHPFGIKLKFPVTFGFYSFSPLDFIESGFPDRVNTLTFVPGVEFEVPVRENWALFPFADVGVGKDFDGGEVVGISTVGVESRALWRSGRFDFTLSNELAWSAQFGKGEGLEDDFAELDTGVELKHPLGLSIGAQELDYALFASVFLYFDTLRFLRLSGDPLDVRAQYEAGVTFGTRVPKKIWGVKLPRIGLSYRHGESVSVIRLVLGNPV